jgi:hypothetical protein
MKQSRCPTSGLVVRFDGHEIELHPGAPPFTFGRGPDRALRFGHNSAGGAGDRDISRNVGSIRWVDGRWVVYNDSETRPFDVIVRGVANPLPPRSSPDSHSEWAVSPPGLDIRVGAPSGRYLLSITTNGPRTLAVVQPEGGDTTFPVPTDKITDHDRLLLAAKFLALPTPGEAIGNREAAEYASAATPRARPVTEKAVENCVAKWCRELEGRGVTEIGGRENINNLGRQLLAWGFLRQEDGRRLFLRN